MKLQVLGVKYLSSYAVLTYVESQVYQGASGVQGRDWCATAVSKGFLEQAAFEFNWKGHFHFWPEGSWLQSKGKDKQICKVQPVSYVQSVLMHYQAIVPTQIAGS